jgi:hypothetical protein
MLDMQPRLRRLTHHLIVTRCRRCYKELQCTACLRRHVLLMRDSAVIMSTSLPAAVHPQAFQESRDEHGLGTLEHQDRPQSSSTAHIKLCPSVAQGLDRACILQQLSCKFGVGASRHVAASLQCELIESVPDGIQALTKRDRTQI